MYAMKAMARFCAAPKQDHIKNHAKHGIMVDTRERIIPTIEEVIFNWQEQYSGAREEIPPDLPTPKWKTVQITTYVNADYAQEC